MKPSQLLLSLITAGLLTACNTDENPITSEGAQVDDSAIEQSPYGVPRAEAGDDIEVQGGSEVVLSARRSVDSDGKIINYLWQQIEGTAVDIEGQENASEITITSPRVLEAENLAFKLSVTDDQGLTSTDSVTISVVPINASPSAKISAPTMISSRGEFLLDGSLSQDGDGAIVEYTWKQVGGPQVSLVSPKSDQTYIQLPKDLSTASLTFSLVVVDDKGAIGKESVVVEVNKPAI